MNSTMVSPTKGNQQSDRMNLSYTDMVIGNDGSVLRRDQIADLRKRYGFCMECAGEPVRLFNVRKSRINPLWSQKEARTVEGESFNGQCLACHPELDPRRSRRRLASMRRESSRYILNSSSRSTHSHASCASSASLQVEDLSSQGNTSTQTSPVPSRSKTPTPPEIGPLASVVDKEARRGLRAGLGNISNGASESRLRCTERSLANSSSEFSSSESTCAGHLSRSEHPPSRRLVQPPDVQELKNAKLKLCRFQSRSTPFPFNYQPPEAARPFAHREREQSLTSIEARSLHDEKDPDADYKKDPDADYKNDDSDAQNSKSSWQDSGTTQAVAAVDETENIIEGLHSLVSDMMSAQESDFLAEIILNAMRSYPYE